MSPRAHVKRTFRSLRVRNYRLFTAGQLVSQSGTWMQSIAQNWLVLQLTHSGTALGITTGLQFLPTGLFGMWGGVIADRFDRRKIIMATQSAAGVLALALGTLTATGAVRAWHVYVLAFLLGIVTLADTPARQAFVTDMVGSEHVANAVGLNSAVFNVSRLIGPALAGISIAAFGVAPAFFINGLSYVAVIVSLMAMDVGALHQTARVRPRRGSAREGLAFVWRARELRATLLLLAVVATLGLNFSVAIPLLAKFTFHRSASGYAGLTAAMAGGALIGALLAASAKRPTQKLLTGTAFWFGAASIAAALAPSMLWASLTLPFAGGFGMAFLAMSNSTLQLGSPDAMRGRVMAIYAMVFLGSTPVGAPLVGWLSGRFGARYGLLVGGVSSLLAATVAWIVRTDALRVRARRVRIEETPPLEVEPLLLTPSVAGASRATETA
jgi:MFS family permease